MRELCARILGASLAAAQISSCAGLLSVAGTPPLFSSNTALQRFDFEQDTLHQPPEGFDARLGRWAVVDSPTAASGAQVLVRGGEDVALLAVKEAEGVSAASGDVAVRVFLGSSGAGLSCDAGQNATSYLVKVEPEARRIALYRKTSDTLTLASEAPASIAKGEWARLGVRCENDRVIGYLDGKPLVKDRASITAFDLALYTDPGVTAQFDDLAYWAKK